jgi:hypothetical protein
MKARIAHKKISGRVARKFPTNTEIVRAVRSVRREVYSEEYGADGGD